MWSLRPRIFRLKCRIVRHERATGRRIQVSQFHLKMQIPEIKSAPLEVEIAKTRYSFAQLKVRLGTADRPMPERTARDVCQRIDRIKFGRRWVYTEAAVARFEEKRTLRAA